MHLKYIGQILRCVGDFSAFMKLTIMTFDVRMVAENGPTLTLCSAKTGDTEILFQPHSAVE